VLETFAASLGHGCGIVVRTPSGRVLLYDAGRMGSGAVVGGEGLGAAWAGALAAYEEVRVIPPPERTLVELLDVGGVIGGLDHWFGWVLEEGRSFADAPGAVARVDFLLEKLDSTLQRADALLRISD